MKVGECWKGRVVQASHLSYEDALVMGKFGHIKSFKFDSRDNIMVKVSSDREWYAYPENLKPVED